MKAKTKRVLFAIAILLALCLVVLAGLLFWWESKRVQHLQQVAHPEHTQVLIFPLNNGTVTAGYQNKRYLEKNNFNHFGADITIFGSGVAQVVSVGDGVVLGTEFCDNNLGYIAVIRYDDVYIPHSGETISIIARYYHMISLTASEGDVVTQGEAIGSIDRSHKWYNHIHIELDTDVEHPFNTPQVSDRASALLIRFPADGATIVEPMSVLVLGSRQRIFVHPNSDCCTDKDEPRFLAAK